MKHVVRRVFALCLCLMMCLSILAPGQADAATKYAYETYKRTGNQANDLVGYALSRVGKKDERGKMCAGFVNTCALAAGMTTSQIKTSATIASPFPGSGQFNFLTSTGATKYGAKAYTWKDFKSGKYKPQKGDLVFYGYIKGSKAGTAGLTLAQLAKKNYYHVHVGIVYNNNSTKTKLYTVDGGQSGSDSKYTWVKKKTRTTNADSGAVSGWSQNGYKVFVMEFIRPNYKTTTPQPTDPASVYLAKCTKTANTCVSIKVSGSSSDYIKSLPCAAKTCSASKSVRKLVEGETLTATAIYKNTGGNYWYKVKADSDGKVGYVYGKITKLNGTNAPKGACTGGPSLSTTTPKYGNPYTIYGTMKTTDLTIIAVSASLRDSNDKILQYKLVQNLSTKSYKLASSPIDMNLKFGKLPRGRGNIAMTVALSAKYIDGNTVKNTTLKYYPARYYYTVK